MTDYETHSIIGSVEYQNESHAISQEAWDDLGSGGTVPQHLADKLITAPLGNTTDAHEQDMPHEINHEVMRNPLYESLAIVLRTAYCHAAYEKGHERHAEDNTLFEEQISSRINKEHRGYALGQALKKIHEAGRLPKERAVKELLGAINYIAIEVIQLKVSDDNHSDAGSV